MWRLGPHSRRSCAYGLGTRLVLPWSAMRHDLGPPGQGSPFPSPGSLFSRGPSASQCRRASSAAVATSEGLYLSSRPFWGAPHHTPSRGLGRVASERHAHPGLGVPLSPTSVPIQSRLVGLGAGGPAGPLLVHRLPQSLVLGRPGGWCFCSVGSAGPCPCQLGHLHRAPPQGRPASGMAARDSTMNDILEAESARPKDLGAPPVFRQRSV